MTRRRQRPDPQDFGLVISLRLLSPTPAKPTSHVTAVGHAVAMPTIAYAVRYQRPSPAPVNRAAVALLSRHHLRGGRNLYEVLSQQTGPLGEISARSIHVPLRAMPTPMMRWRRRASGRHRVRRSRRSKIWSMAPAKRVTGKQRRPRAVATIAILLVAAFAASAAVWVILSSTR